MGPAKWLDRVVSVVHNCVIYIFSCLAFFSESQCTPPTNCRLRYQIQASCTISEARSLGSGALIMAHELAHNMGVDHDGEGVNQDCDGGHQDDHDEDHGQTYDEPINKS